VHSIKVLGGRDHKVTISGRDREKNQTSRDIKFDGRRRWKCCIVGGGGGVGGVGGGGGGVGGGCGVVGGGGRKKVCVGVVFLKCLLWVVCVCVVGFFCV